VPKAGRAPLFSAPRLAELHPRDILVTAPFGPAAGPKASVRRQKSRECGHGGAVTLAAAQKIRNEKIPSGSPFTLRTETLMRLRAMLAPLQPKTQSACRTPVKNLQILGLMERDEGYATRASLYRVPHFCCALLRIHCRGLRAPHAHRSKLSALR
jgi:hypothetical protein